MTKTVFMSVLSNPLREQRQQYISSGYLLLRDVRMSECRAEMDVPLLRCCDDATHLFIVRAGAWSTRSLSLQQLMREK